MPTKGINIVLLVLLLASLGLNLALRRDATQTNREFIPEMARSVPFDSFAPNPNWSDGKTLQPPVQGTIPRGFMPMHYAATPQEALRAGEELKNPFTLADARALDRGAFLFVNFCQPCHGLAGLGDGPVVQRGFPAPPSLLAPHAVQMRDGQLFHVLTYGQANMASYASQLSRDERWRIVLYLRLMQKQAAEEAARAAAEAKAAAAKVSAVPAGDKR